MIFNAQNANCKEFKQIEIRSDVCNHNVQATSFELKTAGSYQHCKSTLRTV